MPYLQIRDDQGHKRAHLTLDDGAEPPELPAGWTLAPADATPLWQPTPDVITLSDWRVALTLWGRLDDVAARIEALVTSADAGQARIGRVTKERFEYANSVLRPQLLALKDVLGFTAAEVDESLWRADRVSQGDLSGRGPLPN